MYLFVYFIDSSYILSYNFHLVIYNYFFSLKYCINFQLSCIIQDQNNLIPNTATFFFNVTFHEVYFLTSFVKQKYIFHIHIFTWEYIGCSLMMFSWNLCCSHSFTALHPSINITSSVGLQCFICTYSTFFIIPSRMLTIF